MKNKEISYEIIDFSVETNVQFRTSVDPGSYIPTHWHRAIEIIYMQEGSLDVTVESESFTIHKGDCILVNGNVLHSTKCTAPNTAILLQIPLNFMEKYIPDLGQLLFLWDYQTEDPVKKTKLMMLNHNFSVRVFHQNINRRQKEMDRLDPVLNYIAEHYKEVISLEEIADIACLQTGYFCRFFKKKMGVTFLEYQNEYRLSFIYKDLITTRDPVHVILERHGFTNYKLFRRMFLEHFGDTPTKIRKQRETI